MEVYMDLYIGSIDRLLVIDHNNTYEFSLILCLILTIYKKVKQSRQSPYTNS